MLIVGEQRDLWFRGNNLTAFLEYAQPRVALTKILRARNTKTFAELLPPVVSSRGNMSSCLVTNVCHLTTVLLLLETANLLSEKHQKLYCLDQNEPICISAYP